jgi:hypothetical protein
MYTIKQIIWMERMCLASFNGEKPVENWGGNDSSEQPYRDALANLHSENPEKQQEFKKFLEKQGITDEQQISKIIDDFKKKSRSQTW